MLVDKAFCKSRDGGIGRAFGAGKANPYSEEASMPRRAKCCSFCDGSVLCNPSATRDALVSLGSGATQRAQGTIVTACGRERESRFLWSRLCRRAGELM